MGTGVDNCYSNECTRCLRGVVNREADFSKAFLCRYPVSSLLPTSTLCSIAKTHGGPSSTRSGTPTECCLRRAAAPPARGPALQRSAASRGPVPRCRGHRSPQRRHLLPSSSRVLAESWRLCQLHRVSLLQLVGEIWRTVRARLFERAHSAGSQLSTERQPLQLSATRRGNRRSIRRWPPTAGDHGVPLYSAASSGI